MEKLQKTDPKFYEFLKEQDAELLDFDVSDAEDEEDGMGGERENEDEEEMQGPEDEQEERFMGEEVRPHLGSSEISLRMEVILGRRIVFGR